MSGLKDKLITAEQVIINNDIIKDHFPFLHLPNWNLWGLREKQKNDRQIIYNNITKTIFIPA